MTKSKSRSQESVAAIATVNQQFGDRMVADGNTDPVQVRIRSTGLPGLDKALGIGGLPEGRLVEVFGPATEVEAADRTALLLRMAATVQAAGGVVAYLDLCQGEGGGAGGGGGFEPALARHLGVDLKALLVSQPGDAGTAFGVIDALIRTGVVDLILVDGYQHLASARALEGLIDAADVPDPELVASITARWTGQAVRRLLGTLAGRRTTVVFAGATAPAASADVGGPVRSALKFYSSVRLEVRRIPGTVLTRIRTVKNKFAAPFQETELELAPAAGAGAGVDEAGVEPSQGFLNAKDLVPGLRVQVQQNPLAPRESVVLLGLRGRVADRPLSSAHGYARFIPDDETEPGVLLVHPENLVRV